MQYSLEKIKTWQASQRLLAKTRQFKIGSSTGLFGQNSMKLRHNQTSAVQVSGMAQSCLQLRPTECSFHWHKVDWSSIYHAPYCVSESRIKGRQSKPSKAVSYQFSFDLLSQVSASNDWNWAFHSYYNVKRGAEMAGCCNYRTGMQVASDVYLMG